MKFEKTNITIAGVDLVVKSSEGYPLILETPDGKENHFWLPNGAYDGHSAEVEETKAV